MTLTLPKYNGNLAHLKSVYVELELRLDDARVEMDNDASVTRTATGRVNNDAFNLTSDVTLTKVDMDVFELDDLEIRGRTNLTLGVTSGDPVGEFNAQPGKPDYAIWDPGRLTSGDKGNIHSNYWGDFVGNGTFTISVETDYYTTASFSGSDGFFQGNTPNGEIYARVTYEYYTSNLGDFVWEDLDGDGIQDDGEPPIANVVVRLYDASTNLLESTSTDAAGSYAFSNLLETTYMVRFTPPDGYTVTAPGSGADAELDSNAAADGWTETIELGREEVDNSIDAGFYRLACLYGYTYWDKDLSLTRSDGDVAATGMVVQAWLDGVQVTVTNSASDGFYEFNGLAPESYEVRFVCNTSALTAVPVDGEAATDPERNRAVAAGADYAAVSYALYSGHGVGEDAGEPINAGFTGGGPMSSGIDLQAYRGADGVYVEFVAYDVEEDGYVTLYLVGPGDTVLWFGTCEVAAGGQQTCRFEVPGLVVGGAYNFVVQDEVNQFWEAYGVRVTPFAAEAIRMSLAGVTLAFASLPERDYEIQWSRRLGDPWLTVTNVVSQGERTTVVVRHPDRASPTGFFRIRMLNTD